MWSGNLTTTKTNIFLYPWILVLIAQLHIALILKNAPHINATIDKGCLILDSLWKNIKSNRTPVDIKLKSMVQLQKMPSFYAFSSSPEMWRLVPISLWLWPLSSLFMIFWVFNQFSHAKLGITSSNDIVFTLGSYLHKKCKKNTYHIAPY